MEIKTGIIITLVLMYFQLLISYFRWKMTAGKMEKTIHGLIDNLGREIKKNWELKNGIKPTISRGRTINEDGIEVKRKWNSFEGYEPEWKAAGFKSEEEWMLYIKENA